MFSWNLITSVVSLNSSECLVYAEVKPEELQKLIANDNIAINLRGNACLCTELHSDFKWLSAIF